METSRKEVEQSLSEITFASVSEKVPQLMDYYLGFDLIEKNDEGTRAAGLMGFKIGKLLCYVPALFLSGKLKATDYIYIKNYDLFNVCDETTIANIIAMADTQQGEMKEPDASGGATSSEVNKALDLFVRPPSSARKAASADDSEFMDVDGLEDFIDKEAAALPGESFLDFLRKYASQDFEHFTRVIANPEVFEKVTRIYSVDELKGALSEAKQTATEKKASNKTDQEDKNQDKVVIYRPEDVLGKIASASLFSDEEKEDLFANGYLIKNAKEGEAASKVLIDDGKKTFEEVTESGVYTILNKKSKLVKALVLKNVSKLGHTNSCSCCGSSSCMNRHSDIIVDIDTGRWVRPNGKEIFCRKGVALVNASEAKVNEILESGKKFSSLSVGSKYIAIGPRLDAHGPFYVKNKTRENGVVCMEVADGQSEYHSSLDIKEVTGARKIEVVGGTAFIPDAYRFFEIIGDEYDNNEYTNKITPGDFKDLDGVLISSGAQRVYFEKTLNGDLKGKIADNTRVYSDRGDVVFTLCSDCGFSLQSAEKVASALEKGTTRTLSVYFTKSAQFPAMMEPNTNAGVTRVGVPQETSAAVTQEMIHASGRRLPATDPSFANPDGSVSPEEIRMLERASDSDSREVFDPAMIGILLRTSRSSAIVKEYIPQLVDNLDRMIRLIIMFYWHNSDFAEDYGVDQMADFEDLLQSAIKSTAKTVTFLQQKAIGSSNAESMVF